MAQRHFISIWFFIGAILVIYGLLILGAGIYGYFVPSYGPKVVLGNLHAGIWWGALLLVLGAIYAYRFFPGKDNK
ncbi:MAG: hypothetical protein P8020_08740 [Acidobacteriota bacterium]